MNKYFNFLQKTVSSYPLGDTELGGKAKDCAEKAHNYGWRLCIN